MPRALGDNAILPLPPQVVAQIKSSVLITSLNDVVLDLAKNALDANATKIDVTVNFAHGGCVVEDDGDGIRREEFQETGGLGKLHCMYFHKQSVPDGLELIVLDTSKQSDTIAALSHGRYGMFLASLGALSFLSVTSRRRGFRSHNTLIMHRSEVLSRLTPAPSQHEIPGHHGTRVSVRDLFGNMPVRVKQRTAVLEAGTEDERQWNHLRRAIIGLLLAWKTPVAINVKDARRDRRIRIAPRDFAQVYGKVSEQSHSRLNLYKILSTFSQAGYIVPASWPNWVPISGSTTSISIKGAVSTQPAPGKQVQFIAIGYEPLPLDSGQSEIYEHVNKLFRNSNFGVVEDDRDIEGTEKERRLHDGCFKTEGYTNRQLRGRKGIDRWPMFFLQISLRSEGTKPPTLSGKLLGQQADMQAITDVLSAMLLEWLAAHYFLLWKRRLSQQCEEIESNSSQHPVSSHFQSRANVTSHHSWPDIDAATRTSLKRKRPRTSLSSNFRSRSVDSRLIDDRRPFSEWSRIRCGKPNFSPKIPVRHSTSNASSDPTRLNNQRVTSNTTQSSASFCTEPVLPGQLSQEQNVSGSRISMSSSNNQACDPGQHDKRFNGSCEDGMIEWIDPSTKEKFQVSRRTGAIIPAKCQHAEQESGQPGDQTLDRESSHGRTSHPLQRLAKGPQTSSVEMSTKPSWFTDFLNNWDNPVFHPVEERIRQVLPEKLNFQIPSSGSSGRQINSAQEIDQAFRNSFILAEKKFSRDDLRTAEILAQVDRKFILAKMCTASLSSGSVDAEGVVERNTLVLIDQHAADERCKVEDLFQDFFVPCSPSHEAERQRPSYSVRTICLRPPISFEVPENEQNLFTRYVQQFAEWGIVYEVMDSQRLPAETHSTTRKNSKLNSSITVVVKALPPAISERCRLEPKHLINILRSEIWKDDRTLKSLVSSAEKDTGPYRWLYRIRGCPQGILDLMNSRACRSAIMFNDQLSVDECKALIERLATCAFPFQCAHGRPSIVPLVDLENGQEPNTIAKRSPQGLGLSVGREEDLEKQSADGTYGEAWKEWRKAMRKT